MAAVAHGTVQSRLRWGRGQLSLSPTPSLDAQLLLGHVLGKPRSWILAHGDAQVDACQEVAYAALIARRAKGEPVAYLLGQVEWADMVVKVTPATLIPRPETELVAETAAELGRRYCVRVAADIGTGSGAIAIYLARHLPEAVVYAVDVSTAALEVARDNVHRQGLAGRVALLEGNLLEPLPERPTLLVANLPYLPDHLIDSLSIDVRHEPRGALAAGADGLDLYRELCHQLTVRQWRIPMVLEIEAGQGEAMREMLHALDPGAYTQVLRDYADLDRIVRFEPGERTRDR